MAGSLSQEYGTGEPSGFKPKAHKAAQSDAAGNKGVGAPNDTAAKADMKSEGEPHGNAIGKNSNNKSHDKFLHKMMP